MIAVLKPCLFFFCNPCARCIALARARTKSVFGHLKGGSKAFSAECARKGGEIRDTKNPKLGAQH